MKKRLVDMLMESGALTRCEPLEKIAHRVSRTTTLSPRVARLILDIGYSEQGVLKAHRIACESGVSVSQALDLLEDRRH